MNQIKLYDFHSSPNCQRVKIVMHEKNLPYETIPVNIRKDEQRRSEFIKLNPYGKVPVIVDEETVLYESCFINEYLDEKYPHPRLLPEDPARRARIRILIDYGLTHLNALHQKLCQLTAQDEKERDSRDLDDAKRQMKNLLGHLEKELETQQPYLAGEFSLLDAALIPRFLRLEDWGILPDGSLPRLGEWLQKMKNRPSVRAIMST